MVSDVRISPAGDKVVFVAAKMRKKENDYFSQMYLYDFKKLRKFTAGPKNTMPRFSPDGKYVAFVSRNEKKSEIRIIPVDGGESEKLIEVDGVTGLKWDGNWIYYSSPVIKKEEDDVKRIESIPFYFNGKGFVYNRRIHLFRLNPRTKKVERITEGDFTVGAWDVRDGKVVFAMIDDETEPWMAHLYTVQNGKLKKLSTRKASISEVLIAPDGERVAVFLKFRKKSLLEHTRLYFIGIEGGEYEKACELDLSYGNALNSDSRFSGGLSAKWIGDDDLLFTVTEGGKAPIYRYRGGKCEIFLDGDRSIECFDYAKDILVFVAQYANYPTEVYVKRKREMRLTNFNRFFRGLKKPEKFTFVASDGEKIDGWILIPDGKTKAPMVLEIHGGPKTAYGYAFMFEFYYLLSEGFAVVFSNPRGSAGYSEKFALQIQGHYGERDYMDLMECVDYVLSHYPVDAEKLFVTGGSYGGFMTNWIVGHTDRFRAAVTQRSISNQISFWGTSDIGPWFNKDQIGGGADLWDRFEHYWDKSPLKYARNIKTPLLIIHSEEDYRCPVEQAYQLFYALKMQKRDTKLVLFPGENHDLSRSGKPQHRIVRLKEIATWFHSH